MGVGIDSCPFGPWASLHLPWPSSHSSSRRACRPAGAIHGSSWAPRLRLGRSINEEGWLGGGGQMSFCRSEEKRKGRKQPPKPNPRLNTQYCSFPHTKNHTLPSGLGWAVGLGSRMAVSTRDSNADASQATTVTSENQHHTPGATSRVA